jgi:hypothetical protein
MTSALQTRQALEDAWKNRLHLTATRYRWAANATGVLLCEQQSELTPSPDGSHAYRQALQAETQALREYRRVLGIFTDLVMGRRIPEEDPAG